MIKRRIPALMLALTPFWLSASISAEELQQVDPVVAIDAKIDQKKADIDAVNEEYASESATLKQLQQNQDALQREAGELEAKRNRSKSTLDKQYARLLDDPETDLSSFQKQYQDAWKAVKDNQSDTLTNRQNITESEMRLSQIKQKKARFVNEFENLKESRIDARVKRISAELRESDVLETSYTTTCSTTMTLGECVSQGKYLTKQKAVKTFKDKLLSSLTESTLARQNLEGVQLNIHVQESQIIKSGFSGDNTYSTQMQAQLQAKPELAAACSLLNVESRYCLKGQVQSRKDKDKQWANVTVRSDQYNDAVTIDGVKYGSTPVEIVLPTGRHQVTVSKDGYETYNRVISINSNDTVWVKLMPNKEG
ncbi:chromosome partitioning protein ParA [Vibrio sp. HA2012]|uniref:PEGA domain-containing protein n=1 Tax=Vibrio sp. HA2012 TaxID=1971595 RepID=UPI000C2C74E1|nr:PEGA domain-containing protein [Vibrio sp. HA2012]PJC87040.1 chromosome partitioning protein ParA [Vibrio sp. HA2012]